MTQETLTTFFGWATVVNFVLLSISALAVITFRPSMTRLHARMFGLEESAIAPLYFQWLAQFKVMAFVTSLVPWIALKMM